MRWIVLLFAVVGSSSVFAAENDAYPALEKCSIAQASNLAVRSSEPTSVLIEAAIGLCATEEAEFAKQILYNFSANRGEQAQSAFEFRMGFLRRALAAAIVTNRTKKAE